MLANALDLDVEIAKTWDTPGSSFEHVHLRGSLWDGM